MNKKIIFSNFNMIDNTIRQILINPELFNISNRKYKNKTPKITSSQKLSQNNTVSRNPKTKILKHIQNIYNQEKKEKKKNILNNLFKNNIEDIEDIEDENIERRQRYSLEENFNNELDESIDYMLNISKNNETIKNNINKNDDNDNNDNNNNDNDHDNDDNNNDDNDNDNDYDNDDNKKNIELIEKQLINNLEQIPTTISPKYGCLKNGKLPTYNNYKRMLKNPRNDRGSQKSLLDNKIINVNPIINITPFTKEENGYKKFLNVNTKINNNESNIITGRGNDIIIDETKKLNNAIKKYNNKKIIRRTFHLGKSKKEPKISVLISNKTIRNQVCNKIKEIYQLPIIDIKKFLIKKGLIKVGSIAPVDILREMYKNVIMLCGDLQNHNTENILYNYINNNKK